MDVKRTFTDVVGGGMELCVVVCLVGWSWGPIDVQLFLADVILDPVESHVHGFGPFLFHGFVHDACGCRVVDLSRCGRLCVAEFFQGGALGDGFFCVLEECATFGIGGG